MEKLVKIKGDGFLSENGIKISKEIVSKYTESFELLESVIDELRKLILAEEVSFQETDEEKQKIISLILAVRMLEITEASLLIMKHGMNNEANSMFRIFLDAYFIIANVCSDKSFVFNYFNSDEAARLKLLNAVKKHDSELFKEINSYASKELKVELKEKIAKEKIQAFNSYAYAKNIGCEGIYDSLYRLMSSSLHTTPRSLGNYVEEENEIVTSINYYPIAIDIRLRVNDYSCYLIKVIGGLSELFEKNNKEIIDSFLLKLKAIGENGA